MSHSPDPKPDPQPDPAPRPHRPHRAALRHGLRSGAITLVVIMLVVTSIMGLALWATGRPLEAPRWMTARVENQLNASMSDVGRVSLGRIVLVVDSKGIPRITLRDVGLYDARGSEVVRLNDVGASLSRSALRDGRLQPEVLRLSGAQAVLRRRADGQFDLSFSGGGQASTGTLAKALDEIDRGFARAPLAGVHQITATDLTLTLEDARSNRIWQVTGGRLDLTHDAQRIDLSMNFEVFNGTEELAQTQLNFSKVKGSDEATVGARFSNAAARDIASQSPALSFLGLLDAPISGAVRARLGEGGSLGALTGTLEIGQGALQPSPDVAGIVFEAGRAYFTFDPAKNRLRFSELSVRTDAAQARASGHAYLRDFTDGWPTAFLGQFALSDVRIASEGMFAEPLKIESGAVDFRLRLDPFTMDLGQIVLRESGTRMLGKGRIRLADAGWVVSADASVDALDHAHLLSFWPPDVVTGTREWIDANVSAGQISNVEAAFRVSPGAKPLLSVGWAMSGAEVQFLRDFPKITSGGGYGKILGNEFTLVIEEGQVAAPQGGALDASGTVIRIPDVALKPAQMQVALKANGALQAGLSLMDLPPFRILRSVDFGPDVASGQAEILADIGFPLVKKLQLDDVRYAVSGQLRDVTSTTLAAPRRLSAPLLSLTASRDAVEIGGRVRLGQSTGEGTWRQPLGEGADGRSSIAGIAILDQGFLDEFGIALPRGSLKGAGRGQFNLDFAPGADPTFEMTSDLNAMALRLAPLGWSKAANRTGQLAVSGHLGDSPAISKLRFDAPGLTASDGRVSLRADGSLDVASFGRVKAGAWLDAPIKLVGRGAGADPLIEVTGGRIDFRKTSIASGDDGGGGGPVSLSLDRLVISEGITLSPFDGQFTRARGLTGQFVARVNGKTPISGTLSPTSTGPVTRILSKDAGGTLKDAGVFETAKGGALDLTLTPTGAVGTYSGKLKITETKMVGASPMAELLSALSVVGLLEQLSGPGIRFNKVDADFRLDPRKVMLLRSSATGPSLGISLDGTYDLATDQMDMQGVVSPFYFLNGIGQVLSRKGEGLFGFNFRMVGPSQDPKIQANPLSILTPGFLRDVFRRPAPKVPTE